MIRQAPGCVLAWGAALVLVCGSTTATATTTTTATTTGREDGRLEITVSVDNPMDQARKSETVVIHLDDLRRLMPALDPATMVVADASGAERPSQLVDMNGDEVADDLVFQDDFAPRASKTFTVRAGLRHQPAAEDYRVYGRFVRERHDDFAWKNDLHIVLATTASAQNQATRMVASVMARAPAVLTDKWTYDTGMVLKGIERVALKTKDAAALAYVKRTIDGLIDASGAIKGYKLDEYNIDQINMGRVLFRLWAEVQGKDKSRYRQALATLRSQMRTHPRTDDGAFWHKKIYPHQMWLDGVYMASPFLAEYAATFHEPALFDDIAKQIVLAEQHMRDTTTGLLYHGWDERKEQRWADPKTGRSPQFWGRAMGWYAMAIVDVLEWLPRNHPQRPAILGVLERLASALARVQDRATGVWWQVLDQPERAGNYREASASSMFVYALSKAVRSGWLDRAVYGQVASRGYQGLLAEFVELRADGHIDLKNVCKMAGLGGKPYRDGSYAYYTSTEVVKNDPKGVGAFILAASENE